MGSSELCSDPEAEPRPIKPDVEIAPAQEDLRQGRDVIVESARKRLAGS